MKTDRQIQQDVQAELRWEPSIGAEAVAGIVTPTIALEVRLPDGKQRDDNDIARSAAQALAWASQVPAAAVQVMVGGGYVTLSGTVDWEYQRRAAAGCVRGLMGVTGASDQIAIQPKIPAAAVQPEIEAALRRCAGAAAPQIQVAARGADVRLTGVLRSRAERDLARHAAWGTHGVCHVADHILAAG